MSKTPESKNSRSVEGIDHPSELKLRILKAIKEEGRVTSRELAELLDLKLENARNRLSYYRRRGLVSYVEEKGEHGPNGAHVPYRRYIYSLTDRGKDRLVFLKKAKQLYIEDNLSWAAAQEKIKD